MNMLEIFAGGPGSGCNPDAGRCGRPRGGKKSGAPMEEGDRAKIKGTEGMNTRRKYQKTTKSYQRDKAAGKISEPGDVVTIMKSFKVGSEYYYQVSLGKTGQIDYVKADQLEFIPEKPGPAKDPLSPQKGKGVSKSYMTPDGTRFTEAKAAPIHERTPELERLSAMRGKFKEHIELAGWQEARWSQVFNGTWPGAKEGQGTTLIVHRDFQTKSMTVKEIQTGQYDYVHKERDYKFKNIGRGVAFVSRRYGISLKLPKGGWLGREKGK